MDQFSTISQLFSSGEIGYGILDTLIMVFVSTLIAYIIGIPLGLLLICTKKDGLFPNVIINKIVGTIVNIGRTIPFIILLVALIPFTRIVIGTSIGVRGMIVPLTIGAIQFVARLVEQSFEEVDHGLIEASKCMGASNFTIITKVYLRESLPSLIRGVSITLILLIGYSSMSGSVGGGGLGDIAIRYGYYNFDTPTMLVIILILIVMVEIIQITFDIIGKQLDKSKRN